MTEMVEFFKLSYYSYRGGKKLHQICSATCIYRTVFELKNILASIAGFGFLCAINPFRYTDFLFQVGDFGISKILTSKSRASTVIGTPSYISPELCEGKHSVTFV